MSESEALAIATAQVIIDSVMDIRPRLKGKIVSHVEAKQLSVKVMFTDGDSVELTGLYAKVIKAHLPQALARMI